MDFSSFKWDENVDFLNPNKIYAYFLDGGIYKTMEVDKRGEHKYAYAFVRLDNKMNYCIHSYFSLIELFKSHKNSFNGHAEAQIFEFPSTKLFLEWCLTQELKY